MLHAPMKTATEVAVNTLANVLKQLEFAFLDTFRQREITRRTG